ncbi:MAG: nuclear transport factor 2 family protein [Solirubrobacteraceae bacterium]
MSAKSLTIEQLVEIEQLRRLKTCYCLAVDAKDWLAYRRLFSDDAVLGGG